MSNDDLSGFSMIDLFRGEVESQTLVFNSGLLALERNSEDLTVIESLMRASHSIKGAARIVQLEDAVQIAHLMEDCFVGAQAGAITLSDAAIDVLFKAVDMLGRVGKGESAQLAEGPLDALLRSLESIRLAAPKGEEAPASEQRELSAFSMFDLFCSEVRTNCGVFNQLLAAGVSEGAALEPFMRAAHSVKGAARVIGLEAIVTLAGALEHLFVAGMEGRVALTNGSSILVEEAVGLLLSAAETTEAGFSRWLSEHRAALDELAAGLATAAAGGDISSIVERFSPPEAVPARNAIGKETHEAQGAHSEVAGREVRITSENLNRLMALAGETVVETRWLDPFAESLLRIKQRQLELVDMLDRLQTSFSDAAHRDVAETTLSEATQSANECLGLINARLSAFEDFSRRSSNLSGRLYRQVIATRMRPFAEGVKPFPRMIRDISRKLNKKARVLIDGLSTEVDRDILEKLEAPLSHLLRNALDHGIETPADRLAAGKPDEGTIRLEAAHRGGMLLITVSDDGRGIDIGTLRDTIVARNLANHEMAGKLTESELFEFLFLPG
ncbi:MAG TPA: Hpt domain-containing protein, partial [Thermoanaerobaculia bacterium]|nr:Hpt domain-containing protein [Thermoanaerobaculia bacterium]